MGLKYLSTVQGLAVSNEFFAEHLRFILPKHVDVDLEALATGQKHDAGSMVEAAVFAVDKLHHAAEDTQTNSPILNLAQWLVRVARQRLESDYKTNAKGLLLERGGHVEATRLPGFPDHAPQFCAVATLDCSSSEAVGSSVKESEQDASRRLLASLGILSNEITTQKRSLVTTNSSAPAHAWVPVNLTQHALAANLKNNESLYEWWMRKPHIKKAAFHRMVMSVTCLPFVAQVDTWCSNFSSSEPPTVEALVVVQLRHSSFVIRHQLTMSRPSQRAAPPDSMLEGSWRSKSTPSS